MYNLKKKKKHRLGLLDSPSLVVKTRRLLGEIKGHSLNIVQLHWRQSLVFTCRDLFPRETVVSLLQVAMVDVNHTLIA